MIAAWWAFLRLRRTRLPTIGCAGMARASLALSLLAEPLADSLETDPVDWTHVVFAWPPPSTESLEKEFRRTSSVLRRSRKFRTRIATRSRGLKTAASVLVIRERPRSRTPDGLALSCILRRVADDGSRWRCPSENHGFDAVVKNGSAASELCCRCITASWSGSLARR